jgi:NSS family neurotransmitter:Na+ symporter
MVTYAAYAGSDFRLGSAAIVVVAGDTAISLLAGFVVFPLVFAHGLDPAAGPGLVFVTLPIAFGDLPGGTLVGAAFFALLFVAALSSAISLLELVVAPAMRRTGWRRETTAILAGIACWIGGLPTVLSFGPWRDARPLAWLPTFEDAGVYDLIDRLTSNALLPTTGLLLSLCAGWLMRPAALGESLGWRPSTVRPLHLALRWTVPAMILCFALVGVVLI